MLKKSSPSFRCRFACRGQSQGYTNVLSDLNICFVAAYTAEAVLKITAMGPWKYIKDNW